jgi:hypothetical protein
MRPAGIKAAIEGGDLAGVRQGFRALVNYPNDESIEAGSPGTLIVALNRTVTALAGDGAVMPRSTCEVLELEAGASYAMGVDVVRFRQAEFAKRLISGYRS